MRTSLTDILWHLKDGERMGKTSTLDISTKYKIRQLKIPITKFSKSIYIEDRSNYEI